MGDDAHVIADTAGRGVRRENDDPSSVESHEDDDGPWTIIAGTVSENPLATQYAARRVYPRRNSPASAGAARGDGPHTPPPVKI